MGTSTPLNIRKLTRAIARLGRRADRRQDDRTVGLGIRDAWHRARPVDEQMKDEKEGCSDNRIGEQDREWLADAVSVEVDRVSQEQIGVAGRQEWAEIFPELR